MPNFDPVEFYTAASKLRLGEGIGGEICHRIVVSRAYYSAFLAARIYTGVLDGTGKAHDEVVKRLIVKPKFAQAGNSLKILRRSRNNADYDLHIPCTAAQSGKALKEAAQILRAFNLL
jgi:uncharacterized protein (UPF0332 family)